MLDLLIVDLMIDDWRGLGCLPRILCFGDCCHGVVLFSLEFDLRLVGV